MSAGMLVCARARACAGRGGSLGGAGGQVQGRGGPEPLRADI